MLNRIEQINLMDTSIIMCLLLDLTCKSWHEFYSEYCRLHFLRHGERFEELIGEEPNILKGGTK